jgi:hypothetical protein
VTCIAASENQQDGAARLFDKYRHLLQRDVNYGLGSGLADLKLRIHRQTIWCEISTRFFTR